MFIAILCLNGVEQPFKRHQCPFFLPLRRGNPRLRRGSFRPRGGRPPQRPLDLQNYWTDFQIPNSKFHKVKNVTRRPLMTSQVRSKSEFSTFRAWWHRRVNFDVKRKQSQWIGMDSVTDICKYHFLCFVTIIQVKVISGHQVKKVKQKNSWFRAAIHVFRSDFHKEREKWP